MFHKRSVSIHVFIISVLVFQLFITLFILGQLSRNSFIKVTILKENGLPEEYDLKHGNETHCTHRDRSICAFRL